MTFSDGLASVLAKGILNSTRQIYPSRSLGIDNIQPSYLCKRQMRIIVPIVAVWNSLDKQHLLDKGDVKMANAFGRVNLRFVKGSSL